MRLEGRICRLRAVEPRDIEPMFVWENDPGVWDVSGTTAPYSREQLRCFVERQQFDIWQTRQMRLMIEPVADAACDPVGAADLYDFDPQHRRAGVGILVYDAAHRRRGYAREALELLVHYAREVLDLHQLWCEVATDNGASLALFRGAGFVVCGVRRDWLRNPDGCYRDAVMMQRILD